MYFIDGALNALEVKHSLKIIVLKNKTNYRD